MAGEGSTIVCRECGAENRAGARFCGGCGAAILQELVCPACGTSNRVTQRFCDTCGERLAGGEEARPRPAAERGVLRALGGGRYEVLRFLGEGGKKRVYLANDSRLRRQVAVAVFKGEDTGDSTGSLRAKREAEAMARLGDHRNVVTVYDMGEEDGQLYLVSQYMSGGDLEGLLSQAPERRLAVEEVLRIGVDIARGLEHAHAHGVVHRDLKPRNVWLAPDGTAKIGDFGLALAAGRTRLTVEGSMVGTVAYMPPEQCLGQPADARSDVYSLGALLYELLCGVPPFVGDEPAVVISQHVSMTPPALTWHRPDVPAALEHVVLKMLAKTPADRPQTAKDVRESFEAIGSATAAVAAGTRTDEGSALDRLTEGSFLGREAESKQLRAAVDGVVAGRGKVALIGGEAGIGKTRLAAEIGTYAELRGARVLWGRCYEGEGAPAYWPWVQVIRAYVHDRDTDSLIAEMGSGSSDIAQIVSEVRERLPDLPEPPALDPEQARFHLFDSITTLLVNAAGARPLAIFLDDLHVADTPSLMLLQFLARELGSTRILLLGTYRDEAVDRGHLLNEIHASLSRTRTYERIRLRGLLQPHVKALLEGVLRQSLESEGELALAEAVFQESEGNPYFIEEIIRHLVESGALYQREGRWGTDAREVDELGIPESIRDAIGRRHARLPEECRELLAGAAVIGREFRLDVLERVAGLDAAAALERLHPAIDGALVKPILGEVNRYGFVHVATRDALYAELPDSRRVVLHKATGEALEELYEDRIEPHLGELAYHFAEAATAGEAARAADYAWWAGEHAAGLYAYEEATAQYERALALFGTLPDEPTRRCELLLALGDVTWRAGKAGRAKQIFLDAASLADELALPREYARAALGYGEGPGGFSVTDRADEQLIELLRSALERLPPGDSAVRVRVMARLAVELYYTGDAVAPDEVSRAAVEMAERVGDTRILLLAMYSRQWATMGPEHVEDNLAAGDEIVRLARVVGDRDMEFQGHHLRLIALMQLGDIRAVDKAIDSCERIAGELRQPAYQRQAAVFRVMRALMQGRFKEADRLAETALSIGQRVDPEVALVTFGVHSFISKWAEGGLEPLAESGRTYAQRYGQAWRAAFIWLLTEIGQLDEARSRFAALADGGFHSLRRNADWLTAVCGLAVASVAIGDPRAAEQLFELLEPYAERFTPVLAGSLCLGSNHAFAGFAARAAGRWDDAARHFERALEANDVVGASYIEPRVRYEYAQALLERDHPGDRQKVAELVEAGLSCARKLGMPGELQRFVGLKLEQQRLGDVDVQTSIDNVARSVNLVRPDLRPAAAPDGTVTIMFSDIEGSTVLTEQLGDQRWFDLLHRHNEIVRRNLREHRGYEVKSQGDGFMVAFASARNAIRCAIGIQRDLAQQREKSPGEPLHVRIGLHTGEVIREREDFFGKNVILAARIAAQARGDEILVSSLLRELVAGNREFDFADARELELKGITGRQRVHGVGWTPAPQDASVALSPAS